MLEHRIFSRTGPDASLEDSLRAVGLEPRFVSDGEPCDSVFEDGLGGDLPGLLRMLADRKPSSVFLRTAREGVAPAIDGLIDLGLRVAWVPAPDGNYTILGWVPTPIDGGRGC